MIFCPINGNKQLTCSKAALSALSYPAKFFVISTSYNPAWTNISRNQNRVLPEYVFHKVFIQAEECSQERIYWLRRWSFRQVAVSSFIDAFLRNMYKY